MGYLDKEGLAYLWQKIKAALAGKQDTITPGDGLNQDGDTLNVDNPVCGIYTQSEFDALPEAQKSKGTYFIGTGSAEKIYSSGETLEVPDGGEVYSTKEQRIGTWIDGKPLYRRVYNLTTPSSTSGGVTIGTIEANINVVSIDGYMTTSVGVHQPINSVYGGNTVGTVTRDTNIKMTVSHSDYVSRPCWVVLEYTKTTDTATTALSARPDATIKLSNSALDLSGIQAAPVTAAAVGVEIAGMKEV